MDTQFPNEVILEMAEPERRLRHYLWHRLRNDWLRFSAAQRTNILRLFPNWEPPRPARTENQETILDNHSGEDFLFMHRQMIGRVNAILQQVGDPNHPEVEGWKSVPMPNDENYPVPTYPGSEGEPLKSDRVYQELFAVYEAAFRNPTYLRTVSLGHLGALVEFTIHNWMHGRWATSPDSLRPNTDSPFNQGLVWGDPDFQWNRPEYDHLGDTYSSHVNPIFWKLHGWVDDCIEVWKDANEVAEIEWVGRWMGPMETPAPTDDTVTLSSADEMSKLIEVAAIASEFDNGFFTAM